MNVEFTVPLLPPSVNHYKQPRRGGGWYRAAQAISFTDAVCIFSRKESVVAEFYAVEITFHLPPAKHGLSSHDLDNFQKVAIDALARAGVISNDGRVVDLYLHKRFCSEDREASTHYSIQGKELSHEEKATLDRGTKAANAHRKRA